MLTHLFGSHIQPGNALGVHATLAHVLIFQMAIEIVEVLVALGTLPTVVTEFGVGNLTTAMRAYPILSGISP